ncbi:hypothetical protein ES703_73694 [subsurface metagenome]
MTSGGQVKLPTYEALLTEAIRFLAVDSGIVTSPAIIGGNSLSDSTKAWATDVHKNRLIKIIKGQGVGQLTVIVGNSHDSLIVRQPWSQNIGPGATYVILEKDLAQILRDVLGGGSSISVANPLETHDPTIEEIEAKLDAGVPLVYSEEIPDTDFALAAIDNGLGSNPPTADVENSIVGIDQVADSTFVLRSLWVSITSLGTAGTKLTFGLWVMLNTVVTQVDSVDVAALSIQNLVDLFGLQEVHADGIWVTVLTDSGAADAACSGTFRYAKAKK